MPISILKNEDGWTPLHIACKNGYVHIIRNLINNNTDVEALMGNKCKVSFVDNLDHTEIYKFHKKKKGRTPLQIACENGKETVVE